MTGHAYPTNPILLIDDDEALLASYAGVLRNCSISNIVLCSDSRKAEELVTANVFDAVLLDLNMPHFTGEKILPVITRVQPEVPVIVITGLDDVAVAVRCMKGGAFDYLVKPVTADLLVSQVRKALSTCEVRRENERLRARFFDQELDEPEVFEEIVTQDDGMSTIFRYVEAVARTSQPIMIEGETGTGKELFARAAHAASKRQGEFVSINVASLDDQVFADTLFGHVKGAFTGAMSTRKGLIEKAAAGTLFLDEIGDISLASQAKLLRLIQELEYFPVGSDVARCSDARIIAATNKDLAVRMEQGAFRNDLYFRFRSHSIKIPSLRERMEDIPLLVDLFLTRAASMLDKPRPTPPKEIYTLLRTYEYPGNVRELEGLIFDAVSNHSGGVLSLDTIRRSLPTRDEVIPLAAADTENSVPSIFGALNVLPTLKQVEGELIKECLLRTKGNRSMTAQLLGVSRQTISRRLGS